MPTTPTKKKKISPEVVARGMFKAYLRRRIKEVDKSPFVGATAVSNELKKAITWLDEQTKRTARPGGIGRGKKK